MVFFSHRLGYIYQNKLTLRLLGFKDIVVLYIALHGSPQVIYIELIMLSFKLRRRRERSCTSRVLSIPLTYMYFLRNTQIYFFMSLYIWPTTTCTMYM